MTRHRDGRISYDAFISYSHAADRPLATALHHALHRFAKPWYRLRALRVFRDETSLAASPALWTGIERVLADCAHFILLTSREAAQSHWVNREVSWWIEHRSIETLFIVLTDGVLTWDAAASDFAPTDAIPKSLAGQFAEEPLHVDLRWAREETKLTLRDPRFRAAVLNLAAPLHGISKEELDHDDVRQHQRVRRLAWSAAVGFGLLVLGLASTSIWAWTATQKSEHATELVASREFFLAALEQVEFIAEEDPSDLEKQVNLSAQYRQVGTLSAMELRWQEASKMFAKAVAVDKRIVEADPSDIDAQMRLAANYGHLGNALEHLKQLAGAQSALESARTLLKNLAEENPANTEANQLLDVLTSLGGILLQRKNLQSAQLVFAECIRLGMEMPDEQKTVGVRGNLAACYNGLAYICHSRERGLCDRSSEVLVVQQALEKLRTRDKSGAEVIGFGKLAHWLGLDEEK